MFFSGWNTKTACMWGCLFVNDASFGEQVSKPVQDNCGRSINVGDRANRALDAGAAEILYKPFHLTMLRDVLRTYLLA
jgi:hypothetical protein